MKLPKARFSEWVQWKKREKDLKNPDFPGIYMLAKFKKTIPKGSADPLLENIIYFGETCKRLNERLRQFDRAAFRRGQSNDNHSGGRSYRERYGDAGENLFVSIFPVKSLEGGLTSYFIRFQERKLILDFVCKHRTNHLLNKK